MSAPTIEFFFGSTNLLRAIVTDINGLPVKTATVTTTIVHALGALKDTELDCSGMGVPITWPVTMVHTVDGKYEYTFAKDLPIERNKTYKGPTNVVVGATGRFSEPYIRPIVDRD